jgi:mRNA interferase MazF
MVCCPMISQIKGYPFKVIIHADGFNGAVLSDQVINIDWHTHKATPKGKASADELDEVRAKISVLQGIQSGSPVGLTYRMNTCVT